MFHSFPLLCAKLNCPKGKKLSKWALTYVELLSCMPEIRLKKTINCSSSWGRARAAQWALGARWWQLSALESVKLTRVKIGEHGRVQHSDSGLLASCRYNYCSCINGNIGNMRKTTSKHVTRETRAHVTCHEGDTGPRDEWRNTGRLRLAVSASWRRRKMTPAPPPPLVTVTSRLKPDSSLFSFHSQLWHYWKCWKLLHVHHLIFV